jgi:hypothetical protein
VASGLSARRRTREGSSTPSSMGAKVPTGGHRRVPGVRPVVHPGVWCPLTLRADTPYHQRPDFVKNGTKSDPPPVKEPQRP